MKKVNWTQDVIEILMKDRKSLTLRQLGEIHGVSPERIRQVLCKQRRLLTRAGMDRNDACLACGLRPHKP